MYKIQERLLVYLLSKLKPGFLPEPVFLEMQRLNHCLSVELILMNGESIYLNQRPETDRFWPNQFQIPGTMVRGNEGIKDSLGRLMANEFPMYEVSEPRFTRYYEYDTPRGHITHLLFTATTQDDYNSFCPLDELPENMVEHHKLLLGGQL